MTEKQISGKTIRIICGDLTLIDVESFVFYAAPDLKLGTGYGGMVSQRGGPKIQDALNEIGSLAVGKAVATTAGKLRAEYIIHAVGPVFCEKETEAKLGETMRNALAVAAEKEVRSVAFPPMGTGFYGIDPGVSAKVMMTVIGDFVKGASSIEDITICVRDPWETEPYESALGVIS
jgi:O-acetyl-ADP-ribose deacetylase